MLIRDFFDPQFVNKLLILLYLINTGWQIGEKNWNQVMYWGGAALLTFAVARGMK